MFVNEITYGLGQAQFFQILKIFLHWSIFFVQFFVQIFATFFSTFQHFIGLLKTWIYILLTKYFLDLEKNWRQLTLRSGKFLEILDFGTCEKLIFWNCSDWKWRFLLKSHHLHISIWFFHWRTEFPTWTTKFSTWGAGWVKKYESPFFKRQYRRKVASWWGIKNEKKVMKSIDIFRSRESQFNVLKGLFGD